MAGGALAIGVGSGKNNPLLKPFIEKLEKAGYTKFEEIDLDKLSDERIFITVHLDSKKYKIWDNCNLAQEMSYSHMLPVDISWVYYTFDHFLAHPDKPDLVTLLSSISYIVLQIWMKPKKN